MAGVGEDGLIWMLCTPAIHKYPLTFAREAKRFVDSRTEPVLHNIVDSRNTAHTKLLQWLGFEFVEEFEYGPNNIPFIEFRNEWFYQYYWVRASAASGMMRSFGQQQQLRLKSLEITD